MFNEFLLHLKHYFIEIIPALVLGFGLSGLAHEFIPQSWVDRNLGKTGLKPILTSTLVGAMLPICCWGSLPVAIGLYKKGAKLGPVLAFLVATPATSISALLVSYTVLGLKFTVFIFFAVIVMGVTIGLVGNRLHYVRKIKEEKDICPHCNAMAGTCGHKEDLWCRVKSVLKYAYIDMPREIGRETLLAIVLAAFVAAYVPLGALIERYLAGAWGYVFSLVFGLLTYVCSTATVPLTDAFMKQGMNVGAGMVFLLAGPVTSYGTILVLRKEFGSKILFIYLGLISIISILLGILYANI
ncbi:MAG: permease [Candidatus Omnitrophica bacterium]|nr:permease [Candidatus Omnitrophota bacterium]